jgi:hypothetical protein
VLVIVMAWLLLLASPHEVPRADEVPFEAPPAAMWRAAAVSPRARPSTRPRPSVAGWRHTAARLTGQPPRPTVPAMPSFVWWETPRCAQGPPFAATTTVILALRYHDV